MDAKGKVKNSKRNPAQQWLEGVPYEVAFWRSYYANRKRRRELMSWSQYGQPCRLDNFDIDAFISGCGEEDPVILDVGCALSYAFGDIIAGRQRKIHYVDALAPFYNRILKRYGIQRPPIRFGMVESLSAEFGLSGATFIHIRNALDHCADPVKGIIQALMCLRVGGVLYLNHFDNEADREAYRGFHQFNITEEDGKLLIWNLHLEKYFIDDIVAPFARVETSMTGQGRVVAVITKTAELPDRLENAYATAASLALMSMDIVEYFHSVPRAIGYQMLRLYCTVGHRFVRRLPYFMQRRLKWAFRRFM